MPDEPRDMIDRAEQVLNYRFKDGGLLELALTHASVASQPQESNERLEFFGDAVLGYVICNELFQRFPEAQEGDLTKIKSDVVSRRVCAQISDQIGLSDLLILGKGMNGRMPSSLAAGVYESIVAAIHLDGGLEAARTFILRTLAAVIEESAESAHQRNFKSLLQQHAQRLLNALPDYILLDEKGPDHSKCFEVCVAIEGKRYPSAWGQSKKQAEQNAALNALEAMSLVRIDGKHVYLADEQG